MTPVAYITRQIERMRGREDAFVADSETRYDLFSSHCALLIGFDVFFEKAILKMPLSFVFSRPPEGSPRLPRVGAGPELFQELPLARPISENMDDRLAHARIAQRGR